MRFGLIANLKRVGAPEAIDKFIAWCRDNGHDLVLSDDLRGLNGKGFEFVPRQELGKHAEILVSMGGDGTFLSAARAVSSTGTSLLGINLGSLGFLTQLTPKQLIPALDAVASGDYQIEERMLMHVAIEGENRLESPYALNDAVVTNGPVSRMIDIDLRVNGEDVVTYHADGLIISTPTGSTAYNLAVGGPIVQPKMQAFIASPISAFTLTTRPMVFADTDVLELTLSSSHEGSILTLDGQVSTNLAAGERVTITKANYSAKYITFSDSSFYKVLKSKLHWGIHPTRGEE